MKKLYLDIETLPAPRELHKILHEIHQKSVDDGKKVKTIEEYIEQTSFNGAFGRIACISYAVNDGKVTTLSGDEKKILRDFWDIAADVTLFIGFNIMNFDMRFIYQRSIILGVEPTQDLNFARYRNMPIYDIMQEWNKWDFQSHINLDALAKAMGLLSSKCGEIEGKNVAQAYEMGKIAEICKYCESDVEVTRKIYKKMIFDNGKVLDVINF